jgi:arylsulfatase
MTLCCRPSQFRRLLVAILGVVTVVGLSLVYFNSRSVLVALSRALVDTNYVASAFGAAKGSTSSVEGSIDMSIVVFYADDWTLKTLGMFNDKVLTPNLDAMAKRGMTFTHNCVTTSICWQSRATMVTGVYTAIHQQLKIWDWAMFDKKVRWRDTLYPKLFSAGYNVGYVGKWHAPMPAEHRPYTFDYFYPYGGKHWRDRDGEVRHITELNGYDSIQYLRNLQNSSSLDKSKFTLTVAFYATHAQDNTPYPFTYEPDNFTGPLYKNISGTFPLPQTATQEAWEQMPWFFDDKNEGRRRWRGRYDTEEHRQGNMEHIYRMATEVDKVVGDIMEEVKRMGVYNKTMFIFTTDNGVFHGGTLRRRALAFVSRQELRLNVLSFVCIPQNMD